MNAAPTVSLLESVRLEVHPDKTKVLCNRCVRKGRLATKYVEVRGMRVEVFPHTASCKYLGRMLKFENWDGSELENRIGLAWEKFMMLKQS